MASEKQSSRKETVSSDIIDQLINENEGIETNNFENARNGSLIKLDEISISNVPYHDINKLNETNGLKKFHRPWRRSTKRDRKSNDSGLFIPNLFGLIKELLEVGVLFSVQRSYLLMKRPNHILHVGFRCLQKTPSGRCKSRFVANLRKDHSGWDISSMKGHIHPNENKQEGEGKVHELFKRMAAVQKAIEIFLPSSYIAQQRSSALENSYTISESLMPLYHIDTN